MNFFSVTWLVVVVKASFIIFKDRLVLFSIVFPGVLLGRDLNVVHAEGGSVLTGLSELALFHAFPDIPGIKAKKKLYDSMFTHKKF